MADKFDFQLLSRIKSDCLYYIGSSNGDNKHLWAGNVSDQLKLMWDMRDKLNPDWLTKDEMKNIEIEMKSKENGEKTR